MQPEVNYIQSGLDCLIDTYIFLSSAGSFSRGLRSLSRLATCERVFRDGAILAAESRVTDPVSGEIEQARKVQDRFGRSCDALPCASDGWTASFRPGEAVLQGRKANRKYSLASLLAHCRLQKRWSIDTEPIRRIVEVVTLAASELRLYSRMGANGQIPKALSETLQKNGLYRF